MVDETRSVFTPRARAMAESFISTTHPIGQMVRVYGGFGDGREGRIVGARQRAQGGPYSSDYPVFYILSYDQLVGGWDAGSLDPLYLDTCPYCGPGACRGSAFTTDGTDIERFHALHPRERKPDRIDMGLLNECHSCGCFGTYDVFGLPTQCPNCSSREVWSFKPEGAMR